MEQSSTWITFAAGTLFGCVLAAVLWFVARRIHESVNRYYQRTRTRFIEPQLAAHLRGMVATMHKDLSPDRNLGGRTHWHFDPGHDVLYVEDLPEYEKDIRLLYDLESRMEPDSRDRYLSYLRDIVTREDPDTRPSLWALYNATPMQRAEALIETRLDIRGYPDQESLEKLSALLEKWLKSNTP